MTKILTLHLILFNTYIFTLLMPLRSFSRVHTLCHVKLHSFPCIHHFKNSHSLQLPLSFDISFQSKNIQAGAEFRLWCGLFMVHNTLLSKQGHPEA